MKFKSANDVRSVIEEMRQVDITLHSPNRANINQLFDGWPPFTEQEASENHISTNVNFLEAPGLAHKARSTWNNAFLKPGNRFTVQGDFKPIHKAKEWSARITREINRPIKKSLRYVEVIRGTGAQVVMHGIGPKNWPTAQRWCPTEIGIEDLLVPSATRVSFDNLSHFAIYRQYTPEQLFRMTHGKQVDPGWNMGMVRKELKRLAGPLGVTPSYQDLNSPERLEKFYKGSAGYLDTDAVPTFDAWDFYFDDEGRWYRKIIPDDSSYEGQGFIYEPKQCWAGRLSEILHCQFGDGANVAPFLYHNVRSLGFLLYAICHLQNRLRCRWMDAVFEATLQYFRIAGGSDRALIGKIDLQHLGFIPEQVHLVAQNERWQFNNDVVVGGIAANRQLMQENAAAFVQDIDQGTQKELTATEVMARLNSANALVSSLLSMAYTYDQFECQEIARRFTIKDSRDPDVRAFRAACLKEGMPEECLNIERWDVQPERVMGGGNKTLELTQAKALMEIKADLDPSAQREVTRNYVVAVSDNADMADRLVPYDQNTVSNAQHDAQLAVGTLMNGAPVDVRQGIDHTTYVDSFLASMQFLVEDIAHLQQNGENPQGWQIVGLTNCYQHVIKHIEIVAQRKEENQRVKQWMDKLKEIMNMVKGWGQQLDEARESQSQQGDGKMQAAILTAQSKARIAEQSAAMKEKRKDMAFVSEQRRRNAQTQADLQRQRLETMAGVQALDMKTAGELRRKRFSVIPNE